MRHVLKAASALNRGANRGEFMKVRIKFAKYGSMVFIGHLDIMRYFQKAMRRAEIDISYSKISRNFNMRWWNRQ